MHRLVYSALAIVTVFAVPAVAQDTVGVDGSSTKFPTAATMPVNGKPVAMKLTGTALRTKFVFNVYAVGSYLQDGVKAESAEEIVKADAAKMLYLVMERDVSTRDFTDAMKTAIAKSHPNEKFEAEFAQLNTALGSQPAKKGDHIMLLASPGGDLQVSIVNRVNLTIKNADFTRAVWDIYLGPKPVTDDIKSGLVSRLGK